MKLISTVTYLATFFTGSIFVKIDYVEYKGPLREERLVACCDWKESSNRNMGQSSTRKSYYGSKSQENNGCGLEIGIPDSSMLKL